MSTNIAERNSYSMVEKVVVEGDLAQLSPQERVLYYKQVCESVGLNPLTKPFEYIRLNNRLTLYAKRDATDQLRRIYGISIKIVAREKVDDLYVVTAQATTADNRTDEAVGAVNLANLKGDAAANAIMKAETKAKRRVTLSIAGMGFLDETEISSIPDAGRVIVNQETGEIEAGASLVKLSNEVKKQVQEQTREALSAGDDLALRQIWSEFDADQKVILWSMFNSQERRAIKELMKDGSS